MLGFLAGADLFNTGLQLFENRRTMDRQMGFQERMSSTQYQRGADDLRAAGLNPIYAASKGMGASSPSGSSIAAPSMPAQHSAVKLAAKKQTSEIENIEASTAKTLTEKRAIEAGMPKKRVLEEIWSAAEEDLGRSTKALERFGEWLRTEWNEGWERDKGKAKAAAQSVIKKLKSATGLKGYSGTSTKESRARARDRFMKTRR